MSSFRATCRRPSVYLGRFPTALDWYQLMLAIDEMALKSGNDMRTAWRHINQGMRPRCIPAIWYDRAVMAVLRISSAVARLEEDDYNFDADALKLRLYERQQRWSKFIANTGLPTDLARPGARER